MPTGVWMWRSKNQTSTQEDDTIFFLQALLDFQTAATLKDNSAAA